MRWRLEATHREPILDILRFLAAILVALAHINLETEILKSEKLQIVTPFALAGNVGVPIFFVVSGYVISQTAARSNNWLLFLYFRFVRLFPGLVVCMLVVMVIGGRFINPYPSPLTSFLSSITLTYELLKLQPLTTVLWTLIVELKFYFAISVLLLLKKDCFSSYKSFLAIMTVLFIFKLIDGGSPFKWLDQNVQGYAHHFILGMVIYFLVKSLRENMEISPLFLLIALALTQDVIRKDQSDLSALLLTLSVIAISISSFIEVPKFFSNQVKLLGLASYPIYLLHTHLGSALCNIFASRVQNEILTLSFALVILTLTSIIIARYIELPAQRYLKSFLN